MDSRVHLNNPTRQQVLYHSQDRLRLAGETEFRQLSPEEVALCQEACRPGGLQVQDAGAPALQPFYKRGLVYLDVPIKPTDHVSIPPLEVRYRRHTPCHCHCRISIVCTARAPLYPEHLQ